MKTVKNTKKESAVHFAIVPGEKKGCYTAICFDYGLIIDGENIFKLKERIEKAALNYFMTIVEDKDLSDDLLDVSLPKKYQGILEVILLEEEKEEKAERLRKKWEYMLNKVLPWQRLISPVKV